jgi:hypothetical protein
MTHVYEDKIEPGVVSVDKGEKVGPERSEYSRRWVEGGWLGRPRKELSDFVLVLRLCEVLEGGPVKRLA